jgi:hypothetical protein
MEKIKLMTDNIEKKKTTVFITCLVILISWRHQLTNKEVQYYAELHKLGLPFSISGELQSFQLTLDTSAWTVRRSKSGISISLFWSSASFSQSTNSRPMNTKKKNNNKKKSKKSAQSTKDDADQSLGIQENISILVAPPTKRKTEEVDQSVDRQENTNVTTEEVDLCSCSSVAYKEIDGVPGVTYVDKCGTCGWTEVRRVRRGRRRILVLLTVQTRILRIWTSV